MIYSREQLSSSVVCLLEAIDKNKSEIGTGNLITANNKFYLVTAEHVARKMKSEGGFFYQIKMTYQSKYYGHKLQILQILLFYGIFMIKQI